MPKVSVIMGVYNCEKYVRQSIDSILAQSFTDWEFIICDDCSTDGTYDIVKDYKEKFPNKFILLANEKNSRLAFSLNRCLKKASGEYIARMDGDDISLPDRFEKQVEFLDSHPEYAVVGSITTRFDENGDYGFAKYPEFPNRFTMKSHIPYGHPTIMMRKSAYDALGGYTVSDETKRCEDYDMWFRFYAAGFEGYNIQEPLLRFREDTNAVKRRTVEDRINASKMLYRGCRLLKYPLKYYPRVLLPIIKIFIPKKVIYLIHKSR